MRGKLINEGKTKKIYAIVGDSKHAIVEYKNAITAFDDPSFTKEFATKAKYSNTTTCGVFELLNRAGIPTHYIKQIGDTEFLALKCSMIPLEVVARRYALGSYLKRHPEFARPSVERRPSDERGSGETSMPNPGSTEASRPNVPHCFDEPRVELFLKTTHGGLKDAEGKSIVEGLDPKKGEEDPLIENPHDATWRLIHPKKPASDPDSSLGRTIEATRVLRGATVKGMEEDIKKALLVLEEFLARHDFKLIDFKVEFGIAEDGRVVIADVIDNDSWRLRDKDWQDVSKQSFRDGEELFKIEEKYALVARLFEASVRTEKA